MTPKEHQQHGKNKARLLKELRMIADAVEREEITTVAFQFKHKDHGVGTFGGGDLSPANILILVGGMEAMKQSLINDANKVAHVPESVDDAITTFRSFKEEHH